MKKIVGILAAVMTMALLCFALVGCGGSSANSTATTSGSQSNGGSGPRVFITVEGYDPIEINLDAENAPISVERFVTLAQEGYYDGLAFYRIQPGFCLQGGTIGNTSAGDDPDLEPIVGEFSENNQNNKLSDDFRRGTLAMARSTVFDSAKSTFFITLATNNQVSQSLNGQYAAFGKVTAAGMKIVDQIVYDYAGYITDDMGTIVNPADMPIIESITIEE